MALARDFGGAFVFGLSCLSAGPASAQVAEPGTGVPLELAQARAEAISELRYELQLSIPDALNEPVTGTNELRGGEPDWHLFFDAAWLGATLSGHSSPAVAVRVRRFLDELPAGYPPHLRMLLLQRTDLLFRAARAQAH